MCLKEVTVTVVKPTAKKEYKNAGKCIIASEVGKTLNLAWSPLS